MRGGFQVKIEDGEYSYKQEKYDVKDTEFQWLPEKLHFSTQTTFQKCPIFFQGQANWPSMDGGEFLLTDLTLMNSSLPLHVSWSYKLQDLQLESIVGTISGVTCYLNREKEFLQGSVSFDLKKAKALFSEDVVDTLEKLSLSSKYSLEGSWKIAPKFGCRLLDTLSFKGKLVGNKAELKGYEIEKIEADVDYCPLQLKLSRLQLRDPAGSLFCELVSVTVKIKTMIGSSGFQILH